LSRQEPAKRLLVIAEAMAGGDEVELDLAETGTRRSWTDALEQRDGGASAKPS
jgi:hypothetical protein